MWPVLCVAAGGAIMRFVARNRSPWAEWITSVTALTIPAGTFAIGLWAFAGQEVPILHLRSIEDALELLWWGFAFLSVCSAGLAWAVAFSAHRVRVLDAQLLVANEQLTQAIASRELECDRIRRTLAHLVHGPVQGRLALAAVMLRQWSKPSPIDTLDESSPVDKAGGGRPSMEQVEELLGLVEDDLEQLPRMVASRSLSDFLPNKANELRGFVDLRWHVADDAFELLGAHPGLERRVTLVVEEAIANAFRHGLAERVDVLIALKSIEAVELSISVTDDGLGVSASDSTGLGMSMFGALTSSWELSRDSHGRTSFTALVAERPVDLSQLAGV
jgi:signal transduction histidine kinase